MGPGALPRAGNTASGFSETQTVRSKGDESTLGLLEVNRLNIVVLLAGTAHIMTWGLLFWMAFGPVYQGVTVTAVAVAEQRRCAAVETYYGITGRSKWSQGPPHNTGAGRSDRNRPAGSFQERHGGTGSSFACVACVFVGLGVAAPGLLRNRDVVNRAVLPSSGVSVAGVGGRKRQEDEGDLNVGVFPLSVATPALRSRFPLTAGCSLKEASPSWHATLRGAPR